tara:strand:+ start:1437 stop:1754 length:318 start_codon:yes stop_codon:yes gene_type:complete
MARRQITIDAVRAFRNGNKFKRNNTEVRLCPISGGRQLRLHGNIIAEMNFDVDGAYRGLYICDGGWQSVTTKERLNGLPNVAIYQKNWQWYLNGEAWNGSLIKVN